MPAPLLSFYGDDFTGSTDAMESLARAGLPTRLFTQPPTKQTLAKYPDLRAFGVAGMTRSMPPEAMDLVLAPVFPLLRASGAPIIHYKVCSTFDSSPAVGSIGRVIERGLAMFGSKFVPIVAAAPALGRYCVFGNLFARLGAAGEMFRLDRHPSMSRHPRTPMDEADLRLHLAKQTMLPMGLVDVLALDRGDAERVLAEQLAAGKRAVLIDLLDERQLATIGRLLDTYADPERPLFVVGSSGVNAALAAHWTELGWTTPRSFQPAGDAGPIVAVCGSMSPVTADQIRWAVANGFVEASDEETASDALKQKKSVVIHSRRMDPGSDIGSALGQMLLTVVGQTGVRRIIVAGGDTSGTVARVLGIESMEMIAELTRGSPLCRITASLGFVSGIEITFKGGQIGRVDFFGQVRKGVSDV